MDRVYVINATDISEIELPQFVPQGGATTDMKDDWSIPMLVASDNLNLQQGIQFSG